MAFGNKKADKEAEATSNAEVLPPEKAALPDTVKEIIDTKGTMLTTSKGEQLPADFIEEMQTGNTGLENVTANNLIIPRITILQSLSPQLQRKKAEFIEGAEMGDFCDTAIGDVYKELLVIPVYFADILLEWAPRSTGKGLVANHGLARKDHPIFKECVMDDKRRWFHGREANKDTTNIISETATFYCLNVTAGGRRVFIPLSSTNRKSAHRWLTLITNERVPGRDGKEFQPPIFYRAWRVTKTEESNSQGDWFGWKFDQGPNIVELDPARNLLRSAKEFMEQARSGLVSGDLSSFAEDGTAEGVASTAGEERDDANRAM
jgi:hypothetical protein